MKWYRTQPNPYRISFCCKDIPRNPFKDYSLVQLEEKFIMWDLFNWKVTYIEDTAYDGLGSKISAVKRPMQGYFIY